MELKKHLPVLSSFAAQCVRHWQVSIFVVAMLSVLLVPFFLPSRDYYEKIYAEEFEKIKDFYIIGDLANTRKYGALFVTRFPQNTYTGETFALLGMAFYRKELTEINPSPYALQANLSNFESALKKNFYSDEMEEALFDSIERIKDAGNTSHALAELKKFHEKYYPHKNIFKLKIAEYTSLLPSADAEALQARMADIADVLKEYYKNATAQDDFFKGLLVEGAINENLGNLDYAYECYSRALGMRPDDKSAMQKIANVLLKTGRFPDAIALLAPAVDSKILKETNPEVTFTLGLAYIGNNDYTSAYTCFEALQSSIVPKEYQFISTLKLADIYFKNNLLEKALELYELSFRKIKRMPGQYQGFVKDFRAKIDSAYAAVEMRSVLLRIINTVETLISVDPSQENYALLGRIYAKLAGLHDREARASMRSGNADEYREFVSIAQKFYIKTATAFLNAYRTNPAAPEANYYLWLAGDSFYTAGSYSPAAAGLKQYIGTNYQVNRAEAYYKLGMSYQKLGQYNEAVRVFDENITLFPYTPPYGYMSYYEKAHSIMLSGNLDNAETAFLDILGKSVFSPLTPEWRLSLFKLGELYYRRALLQSSNIEKKLSDISSAVATLSEAIARYRNEDYENTFRAYYHLAQSYAIKQDWKNAIANYYNAIETGKLGGDAAGMPLSSMKENEEINRNCYFNIADAYFNMQDYNSAAGAYATAWKKFNSRPEMLWALIQEAKCHYNLSQTSDAQKNLELARFAYEKFADEFPDRINDSSFVRWRKEIDDLVLLIGGE